MDFDSFRVATGSALAVTAATTTLGYTMPISLVSSDAASGRSSYPRYVRISVEANAYLNFSAQPGVTANTVTSILFTPNQPEIVNVTGMPYFATIAKTATVVSITPVEV